jgi:hypothetical protein
MLIGRYQYLKISFAREYYHIETLWQGFGSSYYSMARTVKFQCVIYVLFISKMIGEINSRVRKAIECY